MTCMAGSVSVVASSNNDSSLADGSLRHRLSVAEQAIHVQPTNLKEHKH